MTAPSDHPMDRIEVRPLKFDLSAKTIADCVWSRTSPQFAVFMNAVGIHVPYFERYLIGALRQAKPQIKDERLRRDVSAIIGQEANHASNYEQFSQRLSARYPKLAEIDARSASYFSKHAATDPVRRLIGFTAGYETFTFLAGLIILDNYDKWFADADPEIKAFWIWHQVEEVEHGSVAFDVYQYFYSADEIYRKWMITIAMVRVAMETLRAYVHMARTEGWFRNPLIGTARLSFCFVMLWRFARNAFPAYKKGYHPRLHPLVTSSQNKIQMGWRRFQKAGGDVLAIDEEKMARILSREHP